MIPKCTRCGDFCNVVTDLVTPTVVSVCCGAAVIDDGGKVLTKDDMPVDEVQE